CSFVAVGCHGACSGGGRYLYGVLAGLRWAASSSRCHHSNLAMKRAT
ncbi:MAG: hypothetical protein AVDCRST_MAG01-01-536, partial [uncultured Rubrobacteraceae bacterium]